MHKNLRSFIEHLRREKDIVEVTAEVDPYLELAEIHRRVVEEGGPALLFTRVKAVLSRWLPTCLVRPLRNGHGAKTAGDHQPGRRGLHRLLPPRLGSLWGERGWLLDLARVGLNYVPHTGPRFCRNPCSRSISRSCPVSPAGRMMATVFYPAPGLY